MAIISLDFLNKNQFRKYPLKQTSTLRSETGAQLSDNLIVDCAVTSVFGKHRLYISQVFLSSPSVRLTISSALTDEALGIFTGDLGEDFVTLTLEAFTADLSGSITLAPLVNWENVPRILLFNSANAELEESTIFCFTPPSVSSISDTYSQSLTGFVAFGNLINIGKTTDDDNGQIKLNAVNPDTVTSIADKSSFLNNCDNPVIKNINGVKPSPISSPPADRDSNIYIVGILPIKFYSPDQTEGTINILTEDITLDSLCAKKSLLIPPTDISGFTIDNEEFRDKYYNRSEFIQQRTGGSPPLYPFTIPRRYASNFNDAQRPEYYYWPQFVKPEYYNLWALNTEPLPG